MKLKILVFCFIVQSTWLLSQSQQGKILSLNLFLWRPDMQGELVNLGDKNNYNIINLSNYIGMNIGTKVEVSKRLFAQIDFNLMDYNFRKFYNIIHQLGFAPFFTSTVVIGHNFKHDFCTMIKYRFLANPEEMNTKNSEPDYFLFDASIIKQFNKLSIGFNAENILNTKWKQTQFDIEKHSRLETASDPKLFLSDGSPFLIKGLISYSF